MEAKQRFETDTVELFRRIFGDAVEPGLGCRALQARTEDLPVHLAAECARTVLSYNGWDGPAVALWLIANADRIASVSIGREYSPVMYLRLKPGISAAAVRASAARKIKPDESTADPFGVVRLWWD